MRNDGYRDVVADVSAEATTLVTKREYHRQAKLLPSSAIERKRSASPALLCEPSGLHVR